MYVQLKGNGWRRFGVIFLLEHCSVSLLEDINASSASGQPRRPNAAATQLKH